MTIHKMRNIYFFRNLCVLLSLYFIGCIDNNVVLTSKHEITSIDHDLSYIPYDARFDNSNYNICDSTGISSGRNRLKYIGGTSKLRKDITSKYLYNHEYGTFSGYIVVRFLVNCEGKSGRYRGRSLNLDFSPVNAPADLLKYSIELVKSLDTWIKSSGKDSRKEYSKYINLKINNGRIQHVLL